MVVTDPDQQQQPAGFFSTFSILDPGQEAQNGPGRVLRRNRKVFVCIPCHRRKLKCDKGQPCSRCVASGSPDDCVYQSSSSAPNQDFEPTSEAEDAASSARSVAESLLPSRPTSSNRQLRHTSRELSFFGDNNEPPVTSESRIRRLHGDTHWRSIASEFGEAYPYITGTDPQWEPRYRQIQGLEYLFSSVAGINFPLGSVCLYSQSRNQVLESLPPRPLADVLVLQYFATFETTHRLVHREQFIQELEVFWADSDRASDGWLAQLCMMLALGCHASPAQCLAGSMRTAEEWTDLLLDAGQFFLGQAPFFASPTLTTVRTICLAVIALMAETAKGVGKQLVFVMGFLVRLAMTMNLHRATSLVAGPETSVSDFEAEMRNRVWVTIQLLDVDIATRTGTTTVVRLADHDADQPLNLSESDFHQTGHGWVLDTRSHALSSDREERLTDSTFQIKLSEIVPALAEIVNSANSVIQPPLLLETVKTLDSRLRQKLQDAESVLLQRDASTAISQVLAQKTIVQTQFLRVLVHRALLALHHRSFCAQLLKLSSRTQQQIPNSVLAAIQSAISLLQAQHDWSLPALEQQQQAVPMTPLSSPWLLDLCHDDFGAAVLYLMVALARLKNRDWDGYVTLQHDEQQQQQQQSTFQQIPPRAAAWSVLRQSVQQHLRDGACRSLVHFKEFVGRSIALGCLEALERNGQPHMMLQTALLAVSEQIEQTALAGKQDVLWGTAEAGVAGSVQAGLHTGNAPFVDFQFGH